MDLSIGTIFCQCTEISFICQEVPEGAPNCLAGLTFVISGTLDRYSHKSRHRAVHNLHIIAASSLTPAFSNYYFVDVYVLFPCTVFMSSLISCHFHSLQSLHVFSFVYL